MRVIVTGGGTGGHIYPALAIAQGIKNKVPESTILYVGTANGMESKLAPEAGFEFAGVSGQGLPRKLSIETVKVGLKSLKALWETKQILKKFRPDLVVGTGGYVSGPVVLTAALFGIPTILHEQNALPGITNKILSNFVRRVIVTFPESIARFNRKSKLVLAGLPVRREIGQVHRETGAYLFGLSPYKKTILVTGGSRGARSINQAMLHVLQKLCDKPDIQLIWATGKATYAETIQSLKKLGIDWKRPEWKVIEYLKEMPEALACSDICVGRAGAASLAELMVAGKPSILIPYPFAAENHQEYNARAIEQGGAAKVILDKDLTGELLWNKITELVDNPSKLEEMTNNTKVLAQPDALDKIVEECLEIAWK
ncbi:MAG: undecaprenyldiphospho-muramoylpentapeptide beta-N-acetylglucosaminyltransferase [Desulfitobacterium hafniense]|nr:undecaprenyldiphospho-muramoylpentapeptide beta-N-acetylglucosaminyltransferase [Desulfitobacterium hafniense]